MAFIGTRPGRLRSRAVSQVAKSTRRVSAAGAGTAWATVLVAGTGARKGAGAQVRAAGAAGVCAAGSAAKAPCTKTRRAAHRLRAIRVFLISLLHGSQKEDIRLRRAASSACPGGH